MLNAPVQINIRCVDLLTFVAVAITTAIAITVERHFHSYWYFYWLPSSTYLEVCMLSPKYFLKRFLHKFIYIVKNSKSPASKSKQRHSNCSNISFHKSVPLAIKSWPISMENFKKCLILGTTLHSDAFSWIFVQS